MNVLRNDPCNLHFHVLRAGIMRLYCDIKFAG